MGGIRAQTNRAIGVADDPLVEYGWNRNGACGSDDKEEKWKMW